MAYDLRLVKYGVIVALGIFASLLSLFGTAHAQVFGQNQLIPSNQGGGYGGGLIFSSSTSPTGKLFSTSSPTVGYITATSSTATSLFNGNVKINGICTGCGSTFSYPFPSNATTTILKFTNGLFATGSSTIVLHDGGSALDLPLSFTGDTSSGIWYNNGNPTIVSGGFNTISASGAQVQILAGTVGAPSLMFAGDPDTGVWRPGANLLAFSTNGVEAARFNTTQQLGIGSTSPWGQLSASSTSAYPTLVAEQKSTGASGIFLGGNVGIGTTSPGSLLSVQGIVNFTTATSSFYSTGGVDLLGGGCYSVLGTCLQTFIQNATAYKQAVNYATAGALSGTPTYSNGVAGVGATLTEIGLGALTVDGQTASANQRILVKNQSSQFQNGIYVVTNAGSAIANYVLTRTTDYDESTDVYAGTTIPVLAGGTANGDTQWTETTQGTIVMGTSNVVFLETSIGTAALTAVTGSWPIISSGGTTPNITWGGLATSTAAVQGNIPYFSGVNTFANVATSSIAVGAGLTNSSGTFGAQVGGTALTLKQIEHRCFTYATSTWTGTTTIAVETGYGEVWNNLQAYTDVGTLNVQSGYGTASTSLFNASSTQGTVVATPNNTMTAGTKVKFDIGTPASSPTFINVCVNDTI